MGTRHGSRSWSLFSIQGDRLNGCIHIQYRNGFGVVGDVWQSGTMVC